MLNHFQNDKQVLPNEFDEMCSSYRVFSLDSNGSSLLQNTALLSEIQEKTCFNL